MINDHKVEQDIIRNQVSVVDERILQEIETFRSSIARIEEYREARKQVERELDLQYQRNVAEPLDSYMTAVQREREIKSQIEERKTKMMMMRERAHQEETIRQEKARFRTSKG